MSSRVSPRACLGVLRAAVLLISLPHTTQALQVSGRGGATPVPQKRVPSVIGQPVDAATATLAASGLRLVIADPPAGRGSIGGRVSAPVSGTRVVATQTPDRGAPLPRDSIVRVTTRIQPPAAAVMPNVTNLQESVAISRLAVLKIAVDAIDRDSATSASAGTVIGQRPAAGASVVDATVVRLMVAAAPAARTVPNLVDLSIARAATEVQAAGLTLGAVRRIESAARHDTVIDQTLTAGSRVPARSVIGVTVARVSPRVMPDVRGRPLSVARGMIRDAGLAIRSITPAVDDAENPVVVTQSLEPGRSVPPGTGVALTIALAPVTVPSVIGLDEATARARIQNAGLAFAVSGRPESDRPQGTVITQVPQAGTTQQRNSRVAVEIARAVETVMVPRVVGESEATARTLLDAQSLAVEIVGARESTTVAPGTVASQDPAASSRVPRNSAVRLVITRDSRILVPRVIGMSVSTARSTLERAGFRVTVEQPGLTGSEPVDQQVPAGDTRALPGTIVTLTARPAVTTVTVPSVIGLDEATARARIQNAGLAFVVSGRSESDRPQGTVITQVPEAGTTQERNSRAAVEIARAVQTVMVPRVIGESEATARAMLEAQGLVAASGGEVESTTRPAGTVASQDPAPSSQVPRNSAVRLVLTRDSRIPVPRVIGMPLSTARSTLEGAGFRVAVGQADLTGSELVDEQRPAGDTPALRGTSVTLTVKAGVPPPPQSVEVPNVVDSTVVGARQQLASVRLVPSTPDRAADRDIVVGQEPRAGDSVAPGSTVSLTLRSVSGWPPPLWVVVLVVAGLVAAGLVAAGLGGGGAALVRRLGGGTPRVDPPNPPLPRAAAGPTQLHYRFGNDAVSGSISAANGSLKLPAIDLVPIDTPARVQCDFDEPLVKPGSTDD